MKRLLGGAFELTHMACVGALLAASGTMTILRDSAVVQEHARLSDGQAAQVFEHFAKLLNTYGTWLAAAAFAGALLAPHLRGDRRKALAWLRTGCTLGLLYVAASMWPHVTVPEGVTEALADRDSEFAQALAEHTERGFSAWGVLATLSALDFLCAAFQMGGGRVVVVDSPADAEE